MTLKTTTKITNGTIYTNTQSVLRTEVQIMIGVIGVFLFLFGCWFYPNVLLNMIYYIIINPIYTIMALGIGSIQYCVIPMLQTILSNLCFALVVLLGSLMICLCILIKTAISTVPDESTFKPWLEQFIRLYQLESEYALKTNSNPNPRLNTEIVITETDTGRTVESSVAPESAAAKPTNGFFQTIFNKGRRWVAHNMLYQTIMNNLTINYMFFGLVRIAYCIDNSNSSRYIVLGIFNTWIPIMV
jgi:hypothetical protein